MLLNSFSTLILEAGTDEAGRGCLAGPVTAAGVILPSPLTPKGGIETQSIDILFNLLNDSKQLSEKVRKKLRPIIIEHAISFGITHLYPNEIDEINILNASMKGMQECILKLIPVPEFIIVDGNRDLNAKLGLKSRAGKQFTKAEIELLTHVTQKYNKNS